MPLRHLNENRTDPFAPFLNQITNLGAWLRVHPASFPHGLSFMKAEPSVAAARTKRSERKERQSLGGSRKGALP